MTLSEFKAWFEGFTESMEVAPTEAQFAKIKAKVALIDGAVTTYPVFIDRYWRQGFPRPWPYYAPNYPYWTSTTGGSIGAGTFTMGASGGVSGSSYALSGDEHVSPTFDSHGAMLALGRAEALN